MELNEKFKLIAQVELREDDTRKHQALEQFREWIAKQGHIKNCRTGNCRWLKIIESSKYFIVSYPVLDDNFLLRFLRAKKYSNANAFKMLETFLIRSQMFPQWFKHVSIFDDERINELYSSGFIFPLPERDLNGARVIFVQASKLNPAKFAFTDILKILNFVIFTLFEEEETQIAGFVYILDQKGISMDYILLFSLFDVKNYLECVQSAIPARQKRAIWLNLPGFAIKLAELMKALVSARIECN